MKMKCPDCGETDRYVFEEEDEVCYCKCGKEFEEEKEVQKSQ